MTYTISDMKCNIPTLTDFFSSNAELFTKYKIIFLITIFFRNRNNWLILSNCLLIFTNSTYTDVEQFLKQ